MSEERRLHRPGARRIGTAATIVSAGTVALLLTGLPTQANAAVRPCPEPTKPEELPAYLECLRDNIEDGLNPNKPKDPEPSRPPIKPKPEPSKPSPDKSKKPDGSKGSGGGSGGSTTQRPRTPSGTSGGTVTYTAPGRTRPLTPNTALELPGMLPAPQVAPGTGPTGSPAMLAESRLVTPVAAHERQERQEQVLWVAVAAGAAGLVGGLNLSVLSRWARRRVGA